MRRGDDGSGRSYRGEGAASGRLYAGGAERSYRGAGPVLRGSTARGARRSGSEREFSLRGGGTARPRSIPSITRCAGGVLARRRHDSVGTLPGLPDRGGASEYPRGATERSLHELWLRSGGGTLRGETDRPDDPDRGETRGSARPSVKVPDRGEAGRWRQSPDRGAVLGETDRDGGTVLDPANEPERGDVPIAPRAGALHALPRPVRHRPL